jgi:alpha-tubulin suppressor-like RCC1 family protein
MNELPLLARVSTLSLVLGASACGGVVIENASAGGAGGGSSTSSSSAAGSSGSGGASAGTGGEAPMLAPHDAAELAIGAEHTCARFGDGSVKCWGKNNHGQLGLGDTLDRGATPGTMGAALPAIDLGTGRRAIALAAGDDTTCAVLDTHEVKCWGWNPFGMLGLGDTLDRGGEPGSMGDALPPVDLGPGALTEDVHVGNYHACALLHDGTVRCWGDATSSGLGAEHGSSAGTMGAALPPVALGTGRSGRRLYAAFNTTCVILDDGATKCWGSNTAGELGLGDMKPRGNPASTMGDALPAIDFGAPRRAIEVAPSSYSACAILDDGSARCWGNGDDLGLGDGTDHGGVPGTMGAALPAIALGTGRTATAMASGARYTCALLDDHTIKCWGYNPAGQLGLGDVESRGDGPGEMGDALPAVDLGAGRSAIAIAAGGFSACAILDTREVKCWGANGRGQLGQGDVESRGDGPGEMGDALPAVTLW